MRKEMEAYGERSTKRTSSQAFSSKSTFMVEEDLRARFKEKSGQLEAILANAQTIECPIRGCLLFALPEYSADRTEVEKQQEVDNVSASTTEVARAKKAKSEAGP